MVQARYRVGTCIIQGTEYMLDTEYRLGTWYRLGTGAPAGTWRQNDVKSTLMRRPDVKSTSM